MKNKIKSFKDEWENGVAPKMLRNRLDKLVETNQSEDWEVDAILDKLIILKKQLLKFYQLKEEDVEQK